MNYAVLADLNATRANCTSFLNALKELDGNIIYCKFYSYNPKRDCGFSRYIRSAGADVAVPLYNRKKVRIDMRQVIDAVSISCTNSTVDAFFIICAPLDCTPLLSYLKGAGKHVVLGGDSEPSYTSGYDRFVHLQRVVDDEEEKKPAAEVKKPSDGGQKPLLSDEEVARRLNMLRVDGGAEKRQSGEYADSGETDDSIRERKEAAFEEDGAFKGEFLPYTGIPDGEDSMKEVKERLGEIFRAKSKLAGREESDPAPEDMEQLLKKYF